MARNYRKIALNRRVVVNLTTGQAVSGLLWDERGDLIVLRDAQLHEPGTAAPTSMDGEVVIERPRISFVQVVS